MAATATPSFGGMSDSYRHAPRHIPVQDVDAKRPKPQPLSAFMIDPKYLTQPRGTAATAPVRSSTVAVPRLKSLEEIRRPRAQASAAARPVYHRKEEDWRVRMGRVTAIIVAALAGAWGSLRSGSRAVGNSSAGLWHRASDAYTYRARNNRRFDGPGDWKRVALPIAAMLFIIALGVTDQVLHMSTNRGPQPLTTNKPSDTKGSTSVTPAPAATSPDTNGQSSSGTSGSTTTSNTPSTQTNPTPATGTGSSGGTTATPSTTTPITGDRGGSDASVSDPNAAGASQTPLVGGRGGGDGSEEIVPTPPPAPPLQGK